MGYRDDARRDPVRARELLERAKKRVAEAESMTRSVAELLERARGDIREDESRLAAEVAAAEAARRRAVHRRLAAATIDGPPDTREEQVRAALKSEALRGAVDAALAGATDTWANTLDGELSVDEATEQLRQARVKRAEAAAAAHARTAPLEQALAEAEEDLRTALLELETATALAPTSERPPPA